MANNLIYKLFLITKRNPELSVDQYRQDYEEWHAPYCAPMMANAKRYFRRYVSYVGGPHTDLEELEFDSITEVWFDNADDRLAMAKTVAEGDAHRRVSDREGHMFDLPLIRVALVDEEYDSLDDHFIYADRSEVAN